VSKGTLNLLGSFCKLQNHSANIQEFFVYDEDEEAEDCYTVTVALALGPGSVATVVAVAMALSLGTGTRTAVQMRQLRSRRSREATGHQEVQTTTLQANTAIHHFYGIVDEDAAGAETRLNEGDASAITSARDACYNIFDGGLKVTPTPKSLGGQPTPSVAGGNQNAAHGPPPAVNT
jgi:hypothetical protein